MRILFVTPPPYLLNRLHRMRSFDLIRILAKKHEVHLLCVISEKQESEEFKGIKKLCKSINIVKINPLKALINILRFPFLPYEVAYCYSEKATKEMQKIIKRENIDIVYLKRLRSAIYLDEDFAKSNDRMSVILDTTDAMSMFYNRLYNHSSFFPKKIFYKLEEVKYRMFERKTMKKIKNWIVCSEIDKRYLASIGGITNLYVIPNAVDTNYFDRRLLLRQMADRNDIPHSLLFRGLMDKPVNIDACLFFVKEILPRVKKGIKDVKLFIVGPNPHPSIKKLANEKDIFVTGFVKDVRNFMIRTGISICPVRIASGTRFKILQAWAIGQPVVSTTIGAEGLLYRKNQNILVADNPREFAQKITSLLKNKKLYDTLAKNGRKTVVSKYSFNVVSQKLETVIGNVKTYE